MKVKKVIAEDTPNNKYSIEFAILSVVMVVTMFAVRIYGIGSWASEVISFQILLNDPKFILSYIIGAAPFLTLAFMTARWACKKRSFTWA